MRDDNVFKAASGFAGGIAQMNDTCGALLGATMMLSLKYGRSRQEIEDVEKIEGSSIPIAKFYKWFEKEFGSTTCRDIRTRVAGVYYDIKIPWQKELADEAGISQYCAELVGKTAARTAEMLWDAMEEEKSGQ